MATQWHTAFAHLLRPMVEEYYEVATNMPVGDLPREADIVLLRRTTHKKPPFRGLWRFLTEWNILEYKGPSVSPRLNDIDFLVELGLGIHRRLNQERKKSKRGDVPPVQVSFWYLAQRLGPRFLGDLKRRGLLYESPDVQGVWKTSLLEHPIFLVSASDLAVELDCLPFHLLGVESVERKDAVTRLVNEQPALKDLYRDAWASLHPDQIREFLAMARSSKKGPVFHLMPLVDVIGWKEALRQLGAERFLDELGGDRVERRKAVKRLLGHFSETEKEELVRELTKKQSDDS